MLCLKARAKINWTLDILGTREDGYHLMDMLMQSVALHDTLWLDDSDTLSLESIDGIKDKTSDCCDTISSATVTYDENNLVFKAAKILRERTGVQLGARMILEKQIPSGAGMGGGSTDAAAALVGLNKLWKLGLNSAQLAEIGLSIGADLPFMLTGGTARVGGIGEIIKPLASPQPIWLLLIQPCDGLSTKEIFTSFDVMQLRDIKRPNNQAAEMALESRDLRKLGQAMNNVLEPVSIEHRPQMQLAIDRLQNAGAIRAMMTGSGSVIYGVFDTQNDATAAQMQLGILYPNAIVTETMSSGIKIEE